MRSRGTGASDLESLGRQLALWASHDGHEVVATYVDSCSTASRRRPGLESLRSDLRNIPCPFEAIAVTSVDRISRDFRKLLAFEVELEGLKVTIQIVDSLVTEKTDPSKTISVIEMCKDFRRVARLRSRRNTRKP